MHNGAKLSVLLGLALIGAILPACQNKKVLDTKSPFSASVVRLGDTVVAEIDGTSIFFSDVEAAALTSGKLQNGDTLEVDSPVFHTVLDELIDQRVLALEALRQSLDQRDDTRRRLAAMRERILANVVVEDLLAQKITDESLERLYEEQSDLRSKSEQVRARIIKVKTQDAAKAIKTRISNGEDFASLAKEFSIDISTGDIGGDMGYFSQNAVKPEIATLAFSLETNAVSAATKTDDGWIILSVTARRQMPQPTFEDIREDIEVFMTYDEIAKLVKSLRASSDIKLKLVGETDHSPELEKTDKVNEVE